MGLILDSSELVYAERHRIEIPTLLNVYAPETQIGISVLTLTELQHGVRRAQTSEQRGHRIGVIDFLSKNLQIFAVSAEVALLTGDLDAELQMRGERIAVADLLIAATALVHNSVVSTRNLKHFQRVPGLNVISPVLP